MWGSVLFTLLYLALLALCLFLARKRSWVRGLVSLGVSVLTLLEAFLLTRLLVSAWGGPISEAMKEIVIILLGLRGETVIRETATQSFAAFIAAVFLGVFVFLLFFLLLWPVNTLLKRLLVRIITKKKYASLESEKKLPAVGVAATVLSFLAVSFAMLYPLGAASDVATNAARDTEYPLPTSVLTNPISRVYGVLGRPFFDGLTKVSGEERFQNSDELQRSTEMVMAVSNITAGRDAENTGVTCISEAIRSSYLLPDFVSEVVSNAAVNWKAGNGFLNMELELPEGRSGVLAAALLDVLSRWETENLVQDIDTAVQLYKLCAEYNIHDFEDGAALLSALSDQAFTERLFLELSGNKDFIELIPDVLQFGIGSTLDAMHFTLSEESLVDFDASALTEEDWRSEAEIFTRLLARLNRLIDGEIDLPGLLEDLQSIPDSKLLGNFLANLIIQMLQNVLESAGI